MSSADDGEHGRRHRAAPVGRGARPGRTSRAGSLKPLLRERVVRLTRPGWSRPVHVRRAAAALLVVLAGVLAVRGDPASASSEVVVAAHDLAPGAVLTAADLTVVRHPGSMQPQGVLQSVEEVTGRTVAAAVRSGETLTDVRVIGSSLAAASTGDPDSTAVPVRLPDAEVADLLRPGDEVDVLALGDQPGRSEVLASAATVLAVSSAAEDDGADGRLVVLGLPRDDARRVAGASLEQVVTVTFR